MKKIAILFLAFISLFGEAEAQILLPEIISQNAIFQRDKPIKIWGNASPNENITINLGENQAFATADNEGYFEASLKPMKAGGPYRLNLIGKTVTNIDNIMIGEVWLAGGQSNMEWKIFQLGNFYEQETKDANYPNIRILTVNKAPALQPQAIGKTSKWEAINPTTVQNTSAVAYFYALALHKKLGIPIGIISSNWGGTDIETWCERNAIQQIKGANIDNSLDINQFKSYTDYDKALEEHSKKQFTNSIQAKAQTQAANVYTSHSLKNGEFPNPVTIRYPGNWETQTHPNFDGIMWYYKAIQLPNYWNTQNTSISLGEIDDDDSTYVNHQFIGSTQGYNKKRKYKIPANSIKAEEEIKILIRISDYLLGGGPNGDTNEIFISDGQNRISLAGEWQIQGGLNFKEANIPALKTAGGIPSAAGVLYNGMIKPFTKYGIRGVIFYHGSNNAPRAYGYQALLESMINTWRADFNDSKLPFINLQLANFGKASNSTMDSPWAEIREAQQKAIRVGNYYPINTIDLGEANNIHPKRKKEVGERAAQAALEKIYKVSQENHKSPEISKYEIKDNKVILHFKNAKELRSSLGGKRLKGFAIAAADGKYIEAEAIIINATQVQVTAQQIAKPHYIRYAWADNPDGISLVNERGLPAQPFRTDSFELSTGKNLQ